MGEAAELEGTWSHRGDWVSIIDRCAWMLPTMILPLNNSDVASSLLFALSVCVRFYG